jgi:SAM-dependent methyltransferase
MDSSLFHDLLTPAGQQTLHAAVALAPREIDFLSHFQTLSRSHSPELARLALEIAILRLKAAQKFPFADKMYFTRQALEQATPYEVSTYRAERFRPFSLLLDLGCSVGGDTLALAAIGPTLGLDLDPLRLAMAQANLAALGLSDRASFLQADLTHPLPFSISSSHPLFFDPARRIDHRRLFSVQDYHPPLSIIHDWLPHHPALSIKLSPGVDLSELSDYDAEIEFISLRGELKEAVLWFGPLRTVSRRATLLPGPHTLTAPPEGGPPSTLHAPQACLYEPDPAILRAGLVTTLAARLNAAQLDPDIAYLTAQEYTPTPFARAWHIEDWFPFNLKRLRTYLRQRDVGHVTVKKRGSPLEPTALIHSLRLSGSQERLLVLTHLQGRPIVIICQHLPLPQE